MDNEIALMSHWRILHLWNSICNGTFVMVGTKGIIARSTDGGETWEVPFTLVSKKNRRGVVFSNGKFIAVTIDGYIATFTDGIIGTTPEQIKNELGKVVTATLNAICVIP